jgi:hypothetical protein
MRDCVELVSLVSHSDINTQYCPDSLLAKLVRQISGAGSVITQLKVYADCSSAHQDLNQLAANTAALPSISQLVFQIMPQLFNIAITHFIAKLVCQIYSA